MRSTIKHIGYSVAALAVVLGIAVVPVSADGGSGSSDGGGSSSSIQGTPINGDNGSPTGFNDPSPNSGSRTGSTTASETENSTESDGTGTSEDSGRQSETLHSEAEQLLTQQRQNGKEHSEADRQKACQQRQADINKRTAQFAAQAAKHLSTFNSIFTKLQAFHDSKGVTVTNYDALVADATAKQAAAQSAVDALKALNVNIDCTQSDPAGTVATIKAAVSNARTALQDYRTSLKNLVVALKGASTAHDSAQSNGASQ